MTHALGDAPAGDTLFIKIVRKEIPATIVYQDDEVTAFKDINPVAPVHILIVPNKPIPTLDEATPADALLLGKIMLTAQKIAREQGIAESGYRVSMNVRADGGQVVYHMHLHLMGGKKLGRMA